MTTNLATLTPLRTFVAAARLGGFTQASQSLNITQGAVSYQIRTLEEQLEIKLFVRDRRGLVLTSDGAQFLQSVLEALEIVDLAVSRLRTDRGRNALTVTVPTALATKWLISRMADLMVHSQDMELQIVAEDHLVDFRSGDRDAGIRYGNGPWPGVHATQIHRDEIFPVCSPRLLVNGTLPDAESLLEFTLLHETDRNDGPDWQAWLRRAGLSAPADHSLAGASCVICGQASVTIQAAIEGHGVALARGLLIADDLAAGRLVVCLGLSFPSDWAYYFVRPATAPVRPRVEAFRAWLTDAISKTRDFNLSVLGEVRYRGMTSESNGNPAIRQSGCDITMNPQQRAGASP
jgi:LysR family transcriptional regulator, glycine cleavage system transcriptional activator